jgi:N6-L-threonylcarbamoyladenine synthase
MIGSGDLEFSFSGLKTAALTLVRKLEAENALDQQARADIACAFQAAIVEVLVSKSLAALQTSGMNNLVVAGGVGANKSLREKLTLAAKKCGATVYYPPLDLCTDNGAMIAFAAALRLKAFPVAAGADSLSFNIKPRWPLVDTSAN